MADATDTIVLDVDNLTLREIEAADTILGRPVLPEIQSGAAIAALVTVIKRKTDPTFTVDQALDIRVTQISKQAATPDPTAGDAPAS